MFSVNNSRDRDDRNETKEGLYDQYDVNIKRLDRPLCVFLFSLSVLIDDVTNGITNTHFYGLHYFMSYVSVDLRIYFNLT